MNDWLKGLLAAGAIGVGVYSCSYVAGNIHSRDAWMQGTVTSFGREGVLFHTYEGTLALGGEQRSESIKFSLDAQARNGENTESLVGLLLESLQSGDPVRLHAVQPLWSYPWRARSSLLVIEVEQHNE
ncbi:hypothetical protein J4464_04145 [Candidatus Woesearchaeota archaeon]|nr:hypothetical protein [Candidatus Woesearchaeota archaeon]